MTPRTSLGSLPPIAPRPPRRTARIPLHALAALLLAGCAPILAGTAAPAPSSFTAEIDRIFDDAAVSQASWGVLVQSLSSGETIYSRNADRLFLPASNTKLLTAAAALETLGPEYRYRTTLSAGGPVRNGILEGPLVVTGTGDPTISDRFFDDPRDVFRAWADSLRAQGVTRISGGIIAVDTAFSGPRLGSGWAWDDLLDSYAAEYGPLNFNENVLEIDVFPSRTILQPAIVILTPATQAVRVINDTRTMPDGSVSAIRIGRDEFGQGVVLSGEIAANAEAMDYTVTVGQPAEYLAAVLRETLREVGLTVDGPPVHHSELEPFDRSLQQAYPLFVHHSPPLREILAGMMKPSQNLIAEVLLLTVGREVGAEGSAAGGRAVVDSLVTAWELGGVPHRMADGSGLSRYNLASPRLLVSLLTRMDRSSTRDDWMASLPVAAQDGTLANRMRDDVLAGNVTAKTGTLSGARALSGYVTTARGERLAFSIIANNYVAPSAEIDRIAESALRTIVQSR